MRNLIFNDLKYQLLTNFLIYEYMYISPYIEKIIFIER